MTLLLRYMRVDDIPQVINIDRLSFDPPWSARSYNYEISESNYSHMIVLEQVAEEKPVTGLRRLVRSLGSHPPAEREVVGYGGLWHIVDEAHISTIATHPDLRGRGFGELVLAAMVRRSITLQAGYIVLEVRVSNTPAQNLYKKWEFDVVDVKPRYYHNNAEDAYDMRLDLRDIARVERLEARYRELCTEYDVGDEYSDALPPRGQT